MTTYTSEYPSRGGGTRLVLILLIATLLLGAILFAVSNLGVVLGTHAVDKHGEDALAVRKCLDEGGPFMVYKHKYQPIWYLICELDDGRFGFQAVSKDGYEKTAFVPDGGSWKELLDYFGNWATRFKGNLPWH